MDILVNTYMYHEKEGNELILYIASGTIGFNLKKLNFNIKISFIYFSFIFFFLINKKSGS